MEGNCGGCWKLWRLMKAIWKREFLVKSQSQWCKHEGATHLSSVSKTIFGRVEEFQIDCLHILRMLFCRCSEGKWPGTYACEFSWSGSQCTAWSRFGVCLWRWLAHWAQGAVPCCYTLPLSHWSHIHTVLAHYNHFASWGLLHSSWLALDCSACQALVLSFLQCPLLAMNFCTIWDLPFNAFKCAGAVRSLHNNKVLAYMARQKGLCLIERKPWSDWYPPNFAAGHPFLLNHNLPTKVCTLRIIVKTYIASLRSWYSAVESLPLRAAASYSCSARVAGQPNVFTLEVEMLCWKYRVPT